MVTKHIDLDKKYTLEELLEQLDSQTEIVLLRDDKPIAHLTAAQPISQPKKRIPGLHAGMGWISDDFTDELPDSFWLGDE
jgi:antitoxin (DNA-binding transcriptional repressor) of toxin-antitoxin stability system